MNESPDDLRAAVDVAERMASDAALLVRYCKEYAERLAPGDPLLIALRTLSLQCGASCQAIKTVSACRLNGLETPPSDIHDKPQTGI